VNEQVVPSHADWSAPVGIGHVVQDDPHELTLVLGAQTFWQLCVPMGHCPEHGRFAATQAPRHRTRVPGHDPPHMPAVQVAVPFVIMGQAVHDVPHVAGLELLTQLPLQLWKPTEQEIWQTPPTHAACPFGSPGHFWHMVPQAVASSSFEQ
jgi:hypothetical protein